MSLVTIGLVACDVMFEMQTMIALSQRPKKTLISCPHKSECAH